MRNLLTQAKKSFVLASWVYGLSMAALVLVVIIGKLFDIDRDLLMGDPADLMKQPPYLGVVSQFGNLLWSAAAAVCWLSALLLKAEVGIARRWFGFFVAAGMLTTVLCLDDMFQIHESYAVLFVGADADLPNTNRTLQDAFEGVFFVGLAIGFSTFLLRYRGLIWRTDALFLLGAIAYFAASVVFDVAVTDVRGQIVLEEGAKFVGIVSWLVYFAKTAEFVLRSHLAQVIVSPEFYAAPYSPLPKEANSGVSESYLQRKRQP